MDICLDGMLGWYATQGDVYGQVDGTNRYSTCTWMSVYACMCIVQVDHTRIHMCGDRGVGQGYS